MYFINISFGPITFQDGALGYQTNKRRCLFTLGQYHTKVFGTVLFIVVCLIRRNEWHLVTFLKSSPGNVKKESEYRCKVLLPNAFHFVV